MTARTDRSTADDLGDRVEALRRAAAILTAHDVDVPVGAVDAVVAHATARLRHGTAHTVVALAGPTGSGKSSLVNALAGTEVAATGVRRPTTATAQAVTAGPVPAGLLDDLGVTRRHHLEPGGHLPDGLVLLDLPDIDSVATAHRDEVDRVLGLVDLMIWVVDPEKYADRAVHDGYLRTLAGHADVVQVVLNKVDRLTPAERERCLADLDRLLTADGLGDVTPLATSTVEPDGLVALHGVLAAEVAARQAAVARIDADLRVTAARLDGLVGVPDEVDLARLHRTLSGALAAAAGVPDVAALVAAQHRRDARLATGWPPLRWVERIRRAPLAGLRTTATDQVAGAEVNRALRAAGSDVAARVGDGWEGPATAAVRSRPEEVARALDRVVSRRVQDLRRPPRWWGAAGALQTLAGVVAVAGAVWLVALAVAGGVLLVDTTPLEVRVADVPLPTWLLLGGVVVGVVAWLAAAAAAAAGARRRARAVRSALVRGVEDVAQAEVVDPLRRVLDDATAVRALLTSAAG